MERDADPNLSSETLFLACRRGDLETVRLLLDRGADINEFDSNGLSPLMRACQYGHRHVAALLLQRGADVNVVTNKSPALTIACTSCLLKTVDLILKSGAKVNAVDGDGTTALMAASGYRCNVDIVRLLLRRGADVNTEGKNETALICACRCGDNEAMVHLLLDNGAHVNARNCQGRSALMEALKYNNLELLLVLLERGADINAADVQGKTVWMLSQESGACKPLIRAALKSVAANIIQIATADSFTREDLPLVVVYRQGDIDLLKDMLHRFYFLAQDVLPFKKELPVSLPSLREHSFLRSFYLKPLSLFAWSTLSVSQALTQAGPSLSRSQRVDALPLPQPLKAKLKYSSY